MAYEIVRFPYDGTIDADGHVLEPATLWEEYLEARHRDRALRIRVDGDGFEYLEIAGKPSQRSTRGSLGLLGAMGDATARPSPERRYADFDAVRSGRRARTRPAARPREPREERAVSTIGLLWSASSTIPSSRSPTSAPTNRWIADFCRDSRGRLVPIAHVTLLDPEGSADELERAVRDGCKARSSHPSRTRRRPTVIPINDALYARRRGARRCRSRSTRPSSRSGPAPVRFKRIGRAREFFYNVMLRQGVQQAFLSFLALGTLDRFPALRLGVLESGSGWIGSFLDRADAVAEVGQGLAVGLTRKPSEYFRAQCFISGDPDETAAPHKKKKKKKKKNKKNHTETLKT